MALIAQAGGVDNLHMTARGGGGERCKEEEVVVVRVAKRSRWSTRVLLKSSKVSPCVMPQCPDALMPE